ncbi:hypothetical protein EQ500_12535, partial [Lactobacillus sp. XV13L]|nr:hypothetical protein [Lactobacillus sp. XV13L]
MDKFTQIRQEMAAKKADALLVSRPANLSYLLEFTDYEGLIIITPQQVYLYTDGRFFAEIKALVPQFVIVDRAQISLVQFLVQQQIHQLIIEPDFLNVSTFRQLNHQSWQLLDSSNLVEKL